MSAPAETVATLVKEFRTDAGLSQQELAERAGLGVDTIGALERGTRRRPHPQTLRALRSALSLSPEDHKRLLAAAAREPAGGAASSRVPEPRAGIPPDPIAHFVGREDELAELGVLLLRSGRVGVHGLGGTGKTQLVLRFLHEHRAAYRDGVFWLRARRESSLVADLASLAWRLRLPERELHEQERQIDAVLGWLRGHGRWALVLDDLEPEVVEEVARWLPPGLPGHVIATSRTPECAVRLELPPLPLEAACKFLLLRTGEADEAAAGEVALSLGCLPLALEQAAAFVEASGRDLPGYAALLRTRLIDLMAEGKPDDYPQPVATTWQLSFERLEAERQPAAELLRLCAFLAPDDIPLDLLRAGAEPLPAALRHALADDVELDRTIAALRRYSFAERQGERLHVHRLVQAVVRESLGAGDRRAWLTAAIQIVVAGFSDCPWYVPDQWPRFARLVPHAEVVERLAAEAGVDVELRCRLLARVASYLRVRGDLAASRDLHERVLPLRERTLGPHHPDTAASVNNLGVLHSELGDPAGGRVFCERALAIRRRVLGPDHLDTAESLHNLGALLGELGELDAARRNLQAAAAIQERVLGSGHRDTAATLNRLGLVLQLHGELEAARSLFERALAIWVRELGSNHWYAGAVRTNLGRTLHELGDLDAAMPHLERALDIHERALGPDHPNTARCRHYMGLLLRDRGDVPGARLAFQRALRVSERVQGPAHRWTVENRRALEELDAEAG